MTPTGCNLSSMKKEIPNVFTGTGQEKRPLASVILLFITHITFLNTNDSLNSSCIEILQYQFKKEL
jgi:hypothetical protein